MSVQPQTRVTVSSRWIRAALATFIFASGATLLAQEQKDKEKRPAPPPAHRTTPPPANNGGSAPTGHPGGPPATTQTQHPSGPPASGTQTPRYPSGTAPTSTQTPRYPSGNTSAPTTTQTPRYPSGNTTTPAGSQTPRYPSGNTTTPTGSQTPRYPSGNTPSTNTSTRPSFGGGPARPMNNTIRTDGPRPNYHGANGSEVRYRPNGQPQVVQTHGMVITHASHGPARTEYARPDRSVIVTRGSHYGYVQRPFVVNNVSYVHRTYVVGGVTRAYVYRPYMYHGLSLNLYVSSHYYAPAYYGWAYSPWSTPVVFSFGWGARPWFGYYAGYFSPYPTYASPAYWLTDYMVAMTLQDAYQQQSAAAAQANADYGVVPGGQPGLTPDVKQAIADEVHRQLDQERSESQGFAPSQGGPQFLADNTSHVFVVGASLDVQSAAGECPLTEGDVLQMTSTPPSNSATANLAVLASKGQDCRKGTTVSVAIQDLQEMQNHMRETLDQGLAELQSRQGQNGIPAAPAGANRPPVDAPFVGYAPPPDPNVASEVSSTAESADDAENEILDEAQSQQVTLPGSSAPPVAAPQSVKLGMTIDQVVQILGRPQVVGDLGSKKLYSYGNMKVVFIDGKVTDIQ